MFCLICLVTFLNSKKWLQKKIKFVHLTHKTQHVTHSLLRVSNVTLTFPVVSLYFLCWDSIWSCTFWSNSWLLSPWTDRSDVLPGSRPPIKNRLEHSIFLHIIDSFLTQNWTSKFLHGLYGTNYQCSTRKRIMITFQSTYLISMQNYYRRGMPLFPNTFYSLASETKATVSFR